MGQKVLVGIISAQGFTINPPFSSFLLEYKYCR